MINVFSNKKTDGQSEVFKLNADNNKRNIIINDRVFVASGTFNGAVITVTVSGDGVNFAPLLSNTFTAPASKQEYLPNELYIKAEVTGAGASTNVNLHIA